MLSLPFSMKAPEVQATMASAPSVTRHSVETARPSLETQPTSSNAHSLSQAVHARRAEYTRPRKVRIKIGTWNVAACPGTELDLKGWFGEGKGIDRRLAGLSLDKNGAQDDLESIEAQEARRHKKQSTVPRGEESILPHGEEIGLYVLGLQEVVALSSAKQYIGNVYTDTSTITKWREAMKDALPVGYSLVAEQQLSGMMLFIMASPQLAPTISSVSTTNVGTGMLGYLGNKGAVVSRIVVGETTRMVFVNSHLSSGSDPAHLEKRCWDAQQIQQRVSFNPISWAGVLDDKHETIGDEDFAFWFGDLNFRIQDLPGDDIRRILTLHSRGEYDLEKQAKVIDANARLAGDVSPQIHSVESDDDSDEVDSRVSKTFTTNNDEESSLDLPDPDDFAQDPSLDPASLQATIDSLLPHDQLRHVQKQRKAFHDGWREGRIRFLPTYKYDVGSVGLFDTSEKKRAPSWCDRVLYRTRRDKMEHDGKSQEEELARIKDAEMRARGLEQAGEEEDILFDYNPDEDGANNSQPSKDYDEYDEDEPVEQTEEVVTKEGYVDRISLDVYTSHQRVLSSDHKPLEAIFTLDYDAVDPGLKAKVQQEVARELDKAENESRPGITIVVDHSQDSDEEGVEQNESVAGGKSPRIDDTEGFEFGNIAYLQRKSRNMTIANTGQVSATFAFVARPASDGEGEDISPPWLSVRFLADASEELGFDIVNPKSQITLSPGETINAVLEVFVDDIKILRDLNQGITRLEDILILRVTNGRDHFVPVRAIWQESCFGRSIEELIHVPEGGVRAQSQKVIGSSSDKSQEVTWSSPRELIKLTDIIEQLAARVVADANMIEAAQFPTEAAGWPFDSQSWLLTDHNMRESRRRQVLEALDTDRELNSSLPLELPAIERLEIFAEVLLAFLFSIKDGIVTTELWAKIEHDYTIHASQPLTDAEDVKTWVLDVLSTAPNHNISFVFITSMLCRVANELAPVPKMSWRHNAIGSARNSLSNVRRSLSIRNRGRKEKSEVEAANDPAVIKREAVEKAFAAIFAGAVFRGGVEKVGREKKLLEERRRDILEAFLKVGREN